MMCWSVYNRVYSGLWLCCLAGAGCGVPRHRYSNEVIWGLAAPQIPTGAKLVVLFGDTTEAGPLAVSSPSWVTGFSCSRSS